MRSILQELKKIEGTIAHITFQSEKTGFTVLELETEDEMITVVGAMAGIGEGQKLVAFGEYTTHPSFGVQFKAASFEIALPCDVNAILKYLSSGAVHGIGEATAKRLVAAFGEDTFSVIESDPERVSKVQGLSYKKAINIQKEFKKIFGIKDAIAYLSTYGINAQDAIALYTYYGQNTTEIISGNPFVICGEPCNFEFEFADEICKKLSMEYDSRERINGGIMYVLKHNTLKGHSCVPRVKLVEIVAKYIFVEPEKIDKSIELLSDEGVLMSENIDDNEFIFLSELYIAEIVSAEKLCQLLSVKSETDENLAQKINNIEILQEIRYAPKQIEAINKVVNSNVSIITGGPGTGKTTLVKGIISLFEMQGEKISLCAPTGRAAKRLSELSMRSAKTIHRLLEVIPGSRDNIRFVHNKDNPLPCTVLIVDEFSMVDILLFSQLITAVKDNCRVIFVGDYNQLPAVGPGNILKDLLENGRIPSVKLVDIFRQAQVSGIVVNAHNINNGKLPTPSDKDGDFFMLNGRPDNIDEIISQLVYTRLPKAYGLDSIEDIQVLSPSKKRRGGTANLNIVLQQILNPPIPDKKQLNYNGIVFREGDKIMQIKNNYDIEYQKDDGTTDTGVFNGDIGCIEKINTYSKTMQLRFEDKLYEYTQEEFMQLEHAYAITVHKSQGCEFKAVVLSIADTAKELQYRNLLYTAITRAKDLLVVVGDTKILQAMVANHRKQLRYSGMKHFIEEFYV